VRSVVFPPALTIACAAVAQVELTSYALLFESSSSSVKMVPQASANPNVAPANTPYSNPNEGRPAAMPPSPLNRQNLIQVLPMFVFGEMFPDQEFKLLLFSSSKKRPNGTDPGGQEAPS
jgi:hypothetical protein